MRSIISILAVLVLCLLTWSVSPAFADDFDITTSFGTDWTGQEFGHNDADPWKGWANVTVTNTGTEAWGDFHFEIVGTDIENVHFLVESPNEPVFEKGGLERPLSWDVDNDVVGATLDLYFNNTKVFPTETATFKVYTDNTIDKKSFFGLMIYPTPVPEPATLGLVAMAGLALLRRRR